MRIISQGGHADLPYERTHLCSNTENVMAICDGKEYLMGSYATHEKAIKTMEMCRRYYDNRSSVTEPKIFRFSTDEEVRV